MSVLKGLVLTQVALASSIALAQGDLPQGQSLLGDKVIPQSEGTKRSELAGDRVIPSYPVSDPALREKIDKARAAYQQLREGVTGAQAPGSVAGSDSVSSTEQPPPIGTAVILPPKPIAPQLVEPTPAKETKTKHPWSHPPKAQAKESGYRDEAGGVRVFTRNLPAGKSGMKDTFTLPSTSIALATLLYGIEATAQESEDQKVVAELNYAWLGPNDAIVEMKNCRLWIKVVGVYSTERITGTAKTMSCRSPGGETFDIPIVAHVIDKDEEYLGARGELVARGKALASALSFLSDGVTAFGNAMASSQVQTNVAPASPYGGPVQGSNVSGNQSKYIAGQTVAGSTAKFLDWWIDYYQSLAPTIAMGPGKKIYLAIEGTVEVPKIFFSARIDQGQVEGVLQGWKSGDGSPAKVNTTKSITKSAPSAQEGDAGK